jgi:hypothetical protein
MPPNILKKQMCFNFFGISGLPREPQQSQEAPQGAPQDPSKDLQNNAQFLIRKYHKK